jgi:hypothetical protein
LHRDESTERIADDHGRRPAYLVDRPVEQFADRIQGERDVSQRAVPR